MKMYALNIYMDNILFRTDYRYHRDDAQYLLEQYIGLHQDPTILYEIVECEMIMRETV